MAELPTDGGSEGIWAGLYNTFLRVGHAADGTHDQAGLAAQVVNVQTGAVATGASTITVDDSIPQITEGTEFMTLAITPKSATNKLKIEVVFNFAHSQASNVTIALFQDTTANALACAVEYPDSINVMRQAVFTHYMTSGTTSETTFRVRAGRGGSGTTTFNGVATARKFGGVIASSITITEIWV